MSNKDDTIIGSESGDDDLGAQPPKDQTEKLPFSGGELIMEASSESAAHASDAVANPDAGNPKPANHVEEKLPKNWTDNEVEALIKFLKANGIWDKDVSQKESTIIWKKVKYAKGLEATFAQRGLDAMQHKARNLKAKAKANKEEEKVAETNLPNNEAKADKVVKVAETKLKVKGKGKAKAAIDDTIPKESNAVNEHESSEEPKEKDDDKLKGTLERYESLAEGSNDDELFEIFRKQVKGMISKRCEKQKKIVKRMACSIIDDGFDGIKEDVTADVMEVLKAFAKKKIVTKKNK